MITFFFDFFKVFSLIKNQTPGKTKEKTPFPEKYFQIA